MKASPVSSKEQVQAPLKPQGVKNLFDLWKQVLGDISGGSVLDIATARGGFINILMQSLKDYTDIVGMDISEHGLRDAQGAFDQDNVYLTLADAERMSFKDGGFDTVNMCVSLHHLANPPGVLAETWRVLKPGGHFILSEMYRDGQAEPQLTEVYIHQWAAEIDTARGITHNLTLTRREIVDLVGGLGLRNLALYDYANPDTDPKDEQAIQGSDGVIDTVLQRAEGLPDYEAFRQRGEALRQRLYDVGIQRASVLTLVGKK